MPAPNLGLTRLDPGGLPGDWWIGTLPCTQEAGILCGMNDCGQRGIEGTAQAQRRLIQGPEEAHPCTYAPLSSSALFSSVASAAAVGGDAAGETAACSSMNDFGATTAQSLP